MPYTIIRTNIKSNLATDKFHEEFEVFMQKLLDTVEVTVELNSDLRIRYMNNADPWLFCHVYNLGLEPDVAKNNKMVKTISEFLVNKLPGLRDDRLILKLDGPDPRMCGLKSMTMHALFGCKESDYKN